VEGLYTAVQEQDFDVTECLGHLRAGFPDTGSVVAFIGMVRDFSENRTVNGLFIEHYSGMTEKSLEQILIQAKNQFNVLSCMVVHRVGALKATDQIVLVAVGSVHRQEAFKACEWIMDYLKTDALFWKKEMTAEGDRWVLPKESDQQAKARWSVST
jgi:molybdopterin synthase catalytic subunit